MMSAGACGKNTARPHVLAAKDEQRMKLVASCEKGDQKACVRAAVGRPNAEQIVLLEASCGHDDAEACVDLAVSLWTRNGAGDAVRAEQLTATWCRKDRASCSEFGNLYGRGRGLPRDLPRARRLLGLACDADDARGCSDLGALTDDPATSGALIDKACRLGLVRACPKER